jgi:hypothetical protein
VYFVPEMLGNVTPHTAATFAVAMPKSNPPAVSYASDDGEQPQPAMMESCDDENPASNGP